MKIEILIKLQNVSATHLMIFFSTEIKLFVNNIFLRGFKLRTVVKRPLTSIDNEKE